MHKYLLYFFVLIIAFPLCGTESTVPEEVVANAMRGALEGFRFNKRLSVPDEKDHLLLFSRGQDVRIVAWTTGEEGRSVPVMVGNPQLHELSFRGERLDPLPVQNGRALIPLKKTPVFYAPPEPDPYLMLAAAAEAPPAIITVKGPAEVEVKAVFTNPLSEVIMFQANEKAVPVALRPGDKTTVTEVIDVGRNKDPIKVTVTGMGISFDTIIRVENPLLLNLYAQRRGELILEVINPSREKFAGEVEIYLFNDEENNVFRFPIEMGPREEQKTYRLPMNTDQPLPFPLQVLIKQRDREIWKTWTLAETSPIQFVEVGSFEPTDSNGSPMLYQADVTGEGAFVEMRTVLDIPGKRRPDPLRPALMLVYALPSSGGTVTVRPVGPETEGIIGYPSSLSLWIYSDGSGQEYSFTMVDGNGDLIQPDPVVLNWEGWRFVTFPISQGRPLPLRWQSFSRITNRGGAEEGFVLLNGPILNYEFDTNSVKEAVVGEVKVLPE